MIAMCKAMRELANGNFDVVLPGSAAATKSARWRARWKNSRYRPSPRPSAMPPPRTPRTRRAVRRAAPNSSLCRRVRGRGRRHRLERFGLRRPARIRGGNIDANRGNHAKPVQPGRRRFRRGVQATSSRSPPRRRNSPASVDEIGRRVRESSRIAEAAVVQASRPMRASANCRARRRKSATSSS